MLVSGWESEIGPLGGDEINILRAGREVLLASLDVRVRDVQQGLQSTGVKPDGTVMRIEPAP